MVNEPNAEQYDLVLRDIFIEGRDEEKSNVILEIAEPTPEERATHGYFIALAELNGATPKTISMVRAWVEFAIEHYYAKKPSSLQDHFEELLGALNTQSAVYLKQHQNEGIHLLLVAVHEKTVLIGAHGQASALLLYNTRDGFRLAPLTDIEATATPYLFSNVLEGTVRLEDRLLLATPRVTEFFTPDRILKLSENKSLEEMAEHMKHVLGELTSDFSFGVVWAKLVRGTAQGAVTTHKAASSMTELHHKTKSTASILAPPVISFPKEKIVTTILRVCKRSILNGTSICVIILRRAVSTLQSIETKKHLSVIKPADYASRLRVWLTHRRGWFEHLPANRKRASIIAMAVAGIALLSIGSVAIINIRARTAAQATATINTVQEKLTAADNAFTYQNEDNARTILAEAQQLLNTVPDRLQKTAEFTNANQHFTVLEQKIYRRSAVAFQNLADKFGAQKLVMLRGRAYGLDTAGGNILVTKDKQTSSLAHITGITALYSDSDANLLVAQTGPRAFVSVDSGTGATKPINISWLAENSEATTAVFYSGRFYSYDQTTLMIYRYHKKDGAFTNGAPWITDNGKPTGIKTIFADTSLWLLGNNGKILKYTTGKLQIFSVSGDVPKLDNTDALATNGTANVYLLDRANRRLLVTTRDGTLTHQYSFPDKTNLTTFVIDEKETAVFGVTEDGHLVTFPLTII